MGGEGWHVTHSPPHNGATRILCPDDLSHENTIVSLIQITSLHNPIELRLNGKGKQLQ